MKKIYIDKLFHNTNYSKSFMLEPDTGVELDFSNVREIRLNEIQQLLNLQKMAVFNGVALKIDNLQPDISKILEQTGLYKTLNTFASQDKSKILKRLALE